MNKTPATSKRTSTSDRGKERKRYERNGGVKMNHEPLKNTCAPNRHSLNICYKMILI